jgi:anti-sigma factor RsiW
MNSAPRDDELCEMLDAYLDGELDDHERAAVDGLLERSATARSELADIDRVRGLVRGLPQVDVPFGFYERLLRRPRPRARGLTVAAVGTVAAAILLVFAITPVSDQVAPPVEELGARHALLASSTDMPDGYRPMADESMDESTAPPSSAGGFRRMATYEAPEGVHAVYDDGVARVSVFEQRGEVAWDELPPNGERVVMDDDEVWSMPMEAQSGSTVDVVVVDRGAMVVTVIGTMSMPDAAMLADSMPTMDDERSVGERAGDACEWLAEGFGFPD